MAALATLEQLASHLRYVIDNGSGQLALDYASGVVRGYTGQTISTVADDVANLTVRTAGVVVLPERPVTSVSTVTIDGDPVTGWTLDLNELYSDAFTVGTLVEVTYRHGYNPVPDDVKGVVLEIAGARYENPTGKTMEATDDYRGEHAVGLTDAHRQVLDFYQSAGKATGGTGGAFTIPLSYAPPYPYSYLPTP